jgi:hypothetical protein
MQLKCIIVQNSRPSCSDLRLTLEKVIQMYYYRLNKGANGDAHKKLIN